MTALPGGCAVHPYRGICFECQLRATCDITVDPRQCEALERDCAAYHRQVDEQALEAVVGEEAGGDD